MRCCDCDFRNECPYRENDLTSFSRCEYRDVLIENIRLKAERDAVVADLEKYHDCANCTQHCGGCNYKDTGTPNCMFGWQWRGIAKEGE